MLRGLWLSRDFVLHRTRSSVIKDDQGQRSVTIIKILLLKIKALRNMLFFILLLVIFSSLRRRL